MRSSGVNLVVTKNREIEEEREEKKRRERSLEEGREKVKKSHVRLRGEEED